MPGISTLNYCNSSKTQGIRIKFCKLQCTIYKALFTTSQTGVSWLVYLLQTVVAHSKTQGIWSTFSKALVAMYPLHTKLYYVTNWSILAGFSILEYCNSSKTLAYGLSFARLQLHSVLSHKLEYPSGFFYLKPLQLI